MMLFYLIMTSLLFPTIFLCLSILISKKSKTKKIKFSPFQCGFNSFNSPRLSFSLQFFLIAILFLIFDIEIILLLSFPISTLKTFSLFTSLFIVILILMVGLYFEWSMGSLKWM